MTEEQKPDDPLISQLITDIRTRLTFQPDEDEEAAIRRQFATLDRAFSRVLADAETRHWRSGEREMRLGHYTLVLKIQNQCRMTI